MANIEKNYFNSSQASIEIGRQRAEYSVMRTKIEELRKRNAPLYWDILWNNLDGGNLVEDYAKRYAELNNGDWTEQAERNKLRDKFSYLSTTAGCNFPKIFIKRKPDGSFDIDHKAIEDYYIKRYTYTFTDKQVEAIQKLIEGMEGLGIYPGTVNHVFYISTQTRKIEPLYSKLIEMIKK